MIIGKKLEKQIFFSLDTKYFCPFKKYTSVEHCEAYNPLGQRAFYPRSRENGKS